MPSRSAARNSRSQAYATARPVRCCTQAAASFLRLADLPSEQECLQDCALHRDRFSTGTGAAEMRSSVQDAKAPVGVLQAAGADRFAPARRRPRWSRLVRRAVLIVSRRNLLCAHSPSQGLLLARLCWCFCACRNAMKQEIQAMNHLGRRLRRPGFEICWHRGHVAACCNAVGV